MMSQVLTAAGFANERVFATSTMPGGLQIPNQFSEDQPGGRPPETTLVLPRGPDHQHARPERA